MGRQQRRAVQLFILADMVFFACLLFTYFYLRAPNVTKSWLQAGGPTAAAWQSWLIALVTIASALSIRSGVRHLRAGHRGSFDARAQPGTTGPTGGPPISLPSCWRESAVERPAWG